MYHAYRANTKPAHRGLWTALFVIAFIAAAIFSYHWYNSPIPADLAAHVHAP
jgi:hypothetical protein